MHGVATGAQVVGECNDAGRQPEDVVEQDDLSHVLHGRPLARLEQDHVVAVNDLAAQFGR